MTSIYGIRLYELLMQWQTTGTRTIEIDWLKRQFEIADNYPDMSDLKKRVIDPAINDINKNSNYNVSWTQRKTGRRVTHLTFQFSEKLPPAAPEKKAKAKPKPKTDNIEFYAEMRKRFGESIPAGAIPPEAIERTCVSKLALSVIVVISVTSSPNHTPAQTKSPTEAGL